MADDRRGGNGLIVKELGDKDVVEFCVLANHFVKH